ncbi:MAG TPA: hypothetical protein VEK33_17680 [Terriglobales bacterium]|nr:hypothetical protein [Terriglobales bacterium]
MSYNALVFCPEQKTYRTLTQVLLELDFQIEACHEPFAAVKKLTGEHFDAIVVDCANEQNAALLFKSSRHSTTNHASLLIAVVEGQTGVASAFRIGANLVLTKPINVEQSKGTIRVARGLLKKADSPKSAAANPASAQPAGATAELGGTTTGTSARSLSMESAGVSTAVFDLEKEPEAKLEPTEAALLESMPDPASEMLHARQAGSQAAASKLQPVGAGKQPTAAGGSEHGRKSDSSGSALAGHSLSGLGAAAASGPTPLEGKKVVAEMPTPSSSAESQSKRAGGSKKLLMALLVLLLAVAAYWVWQKRHSEAKPGALAQPVIQTPAAPALPPANAEPAATAPAEPNAESGGPTRRSPGQDKTQGSARSAKTKKTAWPAAPHQRSERPRFT